MINTKYYKLLDKVKATIAKDGVTTAIVADLKAMRVMVVEENQPLLAKALRLSFQHIQVNDTFNVAIPEDEPIEDFEEGETEAEKETEEVTKPEIDAVESLDYLLSSMVDISKKSNESDVREFVADLKEQAGEDY